MTAVHAVEPSAEETRPSRAATAEELVERAAIHARRSARPSRPGVTITYAQSLDGSISAGRGTRTNISGDQSSVVAHRLRAAHDAIMVGVNTIIVDDPLLTVRAVEGRDPLPVIVDSTLKAPVTAGVLVASKYRPIIATTHEASSEREALLRARGAEVLRVGRDREGHVDLGSLLRILAKLGIESLMVEGGARLLTTVLCSHLADQALITIAPCFLGGLAALAGPCGQGGFVPRLADRLHAIAGPDLLVYGTFQWPG